LNGSSQIHSSCYLKELAVKIRRDIVQLSAATHTPHIGSSLSTVEILTMLYFHVLRENDHFILSKGHAALALYVVLEHQGILNRSELKNFHSNGSRLPGHPTSVCTSEIEVTTGSLGHGLSIGTGMALAGNRTFVLLSDGECDEGSTWEAALFASQRKLDNLIAVVDYNKWRAFSRTDNLKPLGEKWRSFGWIVREVDGHSFDALIDVFDGVPFVPEKPTVIIAHTVKGKGISFMEDRLEWHYLCPDEKQLEAALNELDFAESQ